MKGRRAPRWMGWSVLCSPMMIAVGAAFVVGMSMVHDAAKVLRRSSDVNARLQVARARLVADMAAVAAFRSPGLEQQEFVPLDCVASVERQRGGLLIEVRSPGTACHVFSAPELPGASPGAFAFALASPNALALAAGGTRVDAKAMPTLSARELREAPRADALAMLRRDPGLALAHWDAGTEQDDFVFNDLPPRGELSTSADLVVVPGHLWIEPGAAALQIILARDLVMVVYGNVYIGRSLRVGGTGRLLLVTAAAADSTAFLDADANGRWSPGEAVLENATFQGPIEGAGNVYLGLGATRARIECGAGLCVAGQLHVLADSRVAGPVSLAHGVTQLGTARLQAAGEWLFLPERERVPGFLTSGPPRPGLLQHIGGGRTTMAKQPLYLAAIVR